MARVRLRFAKLGKIRWTSHRDTARMWERAFRRIELPLAYSSGFSPRPKVSFGLALPTGYESVAEYLDVELLDDGGPSPDVAGPDGAAPGAGTCAGRASTAEQLRHLDGLADRLSAALPAGVDVLATAAGDGRVPSLQEDVALCTWRLAVAPAEGNIGFRVPDLEARVSRVLDAAEIVVTRQRKGKDVTEDIRPAICSLRLVGETHEGVWLECDLATQPRSLRPSELVLALGADLEARNVRRLHQWIERDGARWEPLEAPLAATGAPHALERAS
jgi:hypothetical protein